MEFVILYAGLVAVAIFVVRAYVATFDSTQQIAPPPIPVPLDPVDLALLRAGPGDVVRTVAIGMAERGVIAIRSDGLARIATASVSRTEPIENPIYDALCTKLTFPQLSRAVYPTVIAALGAYEARLRAASLLRPTADLARARFAKLAAPPSYSSSESSSSRICGARIRTRSVSSPASRSASAESSRCCAPGASRGRRIAGAVTSRRSRRGSLRRAFAHTSAIRRRGRWPQTDSSRRRRYSSDSTDSQNCAIRRMLGRRSASNPLRIANAGTAAAAVAVGAAGPRRAAAARRVRGGGSHGGCGGRHGGGCGHGGCSSGCGGGCGGCGG